ncbi:GntR family transcriptional regulator [Thermobifida cellulosilytica]|jgi:Transcriptional regulators|uniref:GntR family transcriptional regulator n=1 Tax=Thermobifida cellulosilytica TB100 TaxID=665004 RepID=A0A147KKN2_THECS|nr:winged helix-turn-helix domain-containing protein [Thermobifida cellulosilytica]KUP97885.1 GntR family transcriptional regulator [Thermobifida cellulosilytica TB100]
MAIDPEDPRPPFQQVANALRAAILTRKLKPGDKLPSGAELAATYGVARMTVQQAIRVLRDEGLVVSQQGRGVYVRERVSRPVGLRPHIGRAFTSETVTIDFAGLSAETLHGALQEPLDQVRHGRFTPRSIRIRILVPDTSVPMAVPTRGDTGADDPEIRARLQRIILRYTQAIEDVVGELETLGLVESATVETRVYATSPTFKLYIINQREVFFGFYPITQHAVTINQERIDIYDLMGRDSVLFHHSHDEDPESVASQYVTQARLWFDSVWGTIATGRS